MGSRIQNDAQQLGFTKARHIVLYAHPRSLRRTAMKSIPDVADAIRDYVTLQDATVVMDNSGGGRSWSFYLLAQNAQLYTEIFIKMAGLTATNMSNLVAQINIYSNNDQYVRGIANAVNTLYADGILAHLEFNKFEKTYQAKKDAIIAEWKKWL